MRKTISLVLAVLLMLALLPAVKLNTAVAEDAAKTYTLVTSADDLTAGDTYLLVSSGEAGSAVALSKQNNNNRPAVEVTITSDKTIALAADQIATSASDAKVFELKLGGNATEGWTFFDAIGNGYLYAPGTGNHLKTQATNDDKGLFTITFNGAALEVVSKADVDQKYLRYNPNTSNNAPLFSCYKVDSSVQNPVYLYKLDAGAVTPEPSPSTEPEPSPSAEPVETKTATLKEGGLDVGDKVVIYNPDAKKVMGLTDYLYNNKKHELTTVDGTLGENDMLTFPKEGAAILTVKKTTGTDNVDRYTFVNEEGKFLEADGTNVQFVATETENTLFQLEGANTAQTDWYIMCNTAVYTDKDGVDHPQYIEYYNNYFTVYSKNGTNPFIFQFYAVGEEPVEPEQPGIVVLFTNDVHCQIDYAAKTLNSDGSVKSPGSWGYGKLAGLKKDLEAAGNTVILVDAGDHIQGGPIGSLTQGEAIIDIMNAVGYDLAIPGNHEFDYGMAQFLDNIVTRANYPYVSANFMDLTKNAAVLEPYKIIEANEKKIAFVGLCTPETITKSTPTYFMNDAGEYIYGFCQDSTGEGVYAAAQAAVTAAKAEGADYVIIVGHMGIDEQSQPWTAPEVIANLTGVDAFIDGHSHSVICETKPDKEGTPVWHGQTGTAFANVGKLTIKADGTMTMELLSVDEAGDPDPAAQAVIDTINEEFDALLKTVVAYTDHDLTVNDPDTGARAVRSAETNLGDLCADAYRTLFDADVAFVNGGGVRANIPAGDITFQQIINVHPFGNEAVLAEVTGQQILDALEMGARVCPSENGGFLQVAGLKYEIHTYLDANCVVGSDKMWQGPVDSKLPYRVQNVQILNKENNEYEPLDLTKKYTLASHNYMLEDMGDGFAMFGPNITILERPGTLDNKVLIDYIQSMPEVDGKHAVAGYTDPRGEGRITIVTEAPAVEPSGNTVILFTNDVHCGIRDGWGYAGLADLKKSLEAQGDEVILVDAGDHSQGGPIGSLTQGEAIIDIMNEVGYDLSIPGNHEFDYGMAQFFNLVDLADYPYVSANFMDLTKNAPALDAYKIFEANGKKIAFVGLSTPESITKSTPTYFMNDAGEYIYGFCQDNTGEGVYTAAQAAVDAAKAEGADYVIIVGHMGIDEQSQPWTAPEVIANISGIDAFIDGHSHSVIDAVKVADKDGKEVLHGQTGTKLANIGKLTIDKNGALSMELLPASEKVKDDPETDEFITTIEEEFAALLNSVVAHTDHDLTVNDPDTGARAVRSAETNLGDLCADAYRYMFDADVAFVNGGGVRANIPTGDITFQQIINVHPFGNTAVLAEVTGQQILDALEMGARVCPSENGGFLQVAGLKYEIHTYLDANCVVGSDKMWQGPADPLDKYRVQNVQILNKETNEYEPLDLEKKYTLASHNYMLIDMGDGFAMFGKNITILEDSGKLDNQVLIDYIQTMPEAEGVHMVEGYNDPRGEGRITIVKDAPPATIFAEEVASDEIAEHVDGKTIYHYDIKIKDVLPNKEVVGIQAFVEYDPDVLTFIDATSALEGSIGINTADNKLMFAWAANGAGMKVRDNTVIVTLNFEVKGEIEDGTVTEIKFTTNANGASSGYSFVQEDTVVEATDVVTEDGSITFTVPQKFTLIADDVTAAEAYVEENGEALYRIDIKVDDLPETGLLVNSAQIFLTYDKEALTLAKTEGSFEWEVTDKGTKLMAVWASEEGVQVNNGDAILTLYFKAGYVPFGTKIDIAFTTNLLGDGSTISYEFGGKILDIEADTADGGITFEGLLGDANCDGYVTAADAATILRSLVQLTELSTQGMFNADVDGDGAVTAADASAILRYIVKLIDKFPVEP